MVRVCNKKYQTFRGNNSLTQLLCTYINLYYKCLDTLFSIGLWLNFKYFPLFCILQFYTITLFTFQAPFSLSLFFRVNVTLSISEVRNSKKRDPKIQTLFCVKNVFLISKYSLLVFISLLNLNLKITICFFIPVLLRCFECRDFEKESF